MSANIIRKEDCAVPLTNPIQTFLDATYLGPDASAKDQLEAEFLETGYIPEFGYDKKAGWILHTLVTPSSVRLAKKEAKRFDLPNAPGPERRIEDALAIRLRASGQVVRRQVSCAAGIADLVTDEAVYEVKAVLTRDALIQALGQVISYRHSINPSLRAVIVGNGPISWSARPIIAAARAIGVEVETWDE